jgi:hypothetical protein
MGNIISTCLDRDIECNSECFDICRINMNVDHVDNDKHHHLKIGDFEYDD